MPVYSFKVDCNLLNSGDRFLRNLHFTLQNGNMANLVLRCELDINNKLRVKFRLMGIVEQFAVRVDIKDIFTNEIHEVNMIKVTNVEEYGGNGDNGVKFLRSSEEILDGIQTFYIFIRI